MSIKVAQFISGFKVTDVVGSSWCTGHAVTVIQELQMITTDLAIVNCLSDGELHAEVDLVSRILCKVSITCFGMMFRLQ